MKSVLIANWKMNPATYKEARALFAATKKAAESAKNVTIIVAPPAIYLRELSKGYRGRIAFAIQHAHAEDVGAHTGDVSLLMAKDAKASYVIVGHAERRAMGETNEDTRKKMFRALKQDITPILCVGENTRNNTGDHFQYIREQLRVGLADIPATSLKKVIIAYEPVWAIGASKPMSPREMHEMSIFIRKTIVEFFGELGMEIRILYGGAIDETTAADMIKNGDVHGLLVGRASTEGRRMSNLLAAVHNI